MPVTCVCPINNHSLKNTTVGFNPYTFFRNRSRQMNTVAVKCAHTVLPFITLVTSTNKSVLCDVLSILKIGRNGKQYLNSVRMCLNFLQQ